MILRAKALKANGTKGSGFWYVASVYLDETGQPSFTMSLDRKKARKFTAETAKKFNDKFIELGIIDAPFELHD